jgi:hypothetical protein
MPHIPIKASWGEWSNLRINKNIYPAAAETLKLAWKQAQIQVLTVGHTPDNEIHTGCIRGHTHKIYLSRKLAAYEIFQLLYVDYGAFPFPTRLDLIEGLTLIHSHLARFGLEVHIGRGGGPSKTECVFFPPPPIFQRLRYSPITDRRQ